MRYANPMCYGRMSEESNNPIHVHVGKVDKNPKSQVGANLRLRCEPFPRQRDRIVRPMNR